MAATVTETKTPATESRAHSWKRTLIYIVGGVVTFILVLALFVNTATQEAVKASNLFVDNIQEGNATAAYEQFSSEAKNVVKADAFQDVVAQIGPILNSDEKVTGKEISKETGSDATAQVTYEIKGSDGKTYDFIVNLTKEGDSWQILNFDSSAK